MRSIDIHSHIVVPEVTRAFGNEPWRPVIKPVRGGQQVRNNQMDHPLVPREITDISGILRDMDEMQIDIMAISPPPFTFFYELSPESGLHAAQLQNDAIARINSDYPHRFAGLAIVPLQDIALALVELQRAVNDLRLHGVAIGSNVQGTYLGDSQFEPFWEAVADMDVCVFIHPDYFQKQMPPTLKEYFLNNLVGNPVETGLTAAHIVFSGLFERYPRLKVVLAHGGGVMPWLKGRWRHGSEVRPELHQLLQRPVIESINRFYVDTVVHDPRALYYLVDSFGPDHVLLGSDFPFDMGPKSPVQEVEKLDISSEHKAKILGRNAARLMGLNTADDDIPVR